MRWLTAGESHGKAISAIIEGVPAGLTIDFESINKELKRRMQGYGRGKRMQIESDNIEILSGVRHGFSMGSPIQCVIWNRDYENWEEVMSVSGTNDNSRSISRPRPGHADFAGMLKYNFNDARNVLERASARETAMRVAVGAIAKLFLKEFGITVASHVIGMGEIKVPEHQLMGLRESNINDIADKSPVRCLSTEHSKQMMALIDLRKESGDTSGGVSEIVIKGLIPGLGTYVQWDKKLDGRLAGALMSIQAIKGVEVGLGFRAAELPGSKVHDEIIMTDNTISRTGNNSGGIEGGMSNGEDIILRFAMKPISTLKMPLKSVDMKTKEIKSAHYERSDVAAVAASSIVGEAVCATEIMQVFLEKFGEDSLSEIKENYKNYTEYLGKRLKK